MNRKMNEEISFKREKKRKNIFELKLTPSIVGNFSLTIRIARVYWLFQFFQGKFFRRKILAVLFPPLHLSLATPLSPFRIFLPQSTTFSLCRTVALNYSTIHHFPYTKCKTLTYGTPVTYQPSSIDKKFDTRHRKKKYTGLDNRYTRSRKYDNIL